MTRILFLGLVTCLAAACASSPPPPANGPAATARMQEARPTSSLDVTRSDELTTIELVKEKAEELVLVKKRVRELEEELKGATRLAEDEATRAREQDAQVQRLQDLLARMTADQAKLNERVLSLEIEKLRLEKQILDVKLAGLAVDGK